MAYVSESDQAVSVITSGSVVAIGGSVNAGAPMRLVSSLIRSGATNLTIVGGMTGTLALDFLIASGCVSKIICPYVGNPEVSPVGPAFRFSALNGEIEIVETDEGVHLVALRAAAAGLPFGVWRASVGTSLPALNSGIELLEENGRAYFKVAPLHIDVALLWAPRCSTHGDIAWWRVSLGDIELAHAAGHRIVQVDQITDDPVTLLDARNFSSSLADVVVVAPEGPFPFAGPKNDLDLEFLRSYARSKNLNDCKSFVKEHFGAAQ